MRAGLGVSSAIDPEKASREAIGLACERGGTGRPDATLLVVTAAHGSGIARVVEVAAHELGGAPFVGASVEGVVAPDVEIAGNPAVLALTLSGVETRTFLAGDLVGDEARAGDELRYRAGGCLAPDDAVLALVDPVSLRPGRLLAALRDAAGPAVLLGAAAASLERARALVFRGGGESGGHEIACDGVAGLVIRAPRRARTGVARACRQVSQSLEITRARGNWIHGLDGRRALDVYREAAGPRLASDLHGAARFLMVGLVDPGSPDPFAVELSVRNVVGFDERQGAISLPEPVSSGRRVALVALDPDAAREDLEALLGRLAKPLPAFGFYLNCRARGAGLFGHPGVEASQLANLFADCPIAGISAPFQLAGHERGVAPSVLTYAGVLAVFDAC